MNEAASPGPGDRSELEVGMAGADPAPGSRSARICPFLRSVDDHDCLRPAVEWMDDRNRCAALAQPSPQSPRQQYLVCLQQAHVDCPRYLRGALLIQEGSPNALRGRAITRATAAALLVLLASASFSLAVVMARGGLDLPAAASPGSTDAALASPAASATPISMATPFPVATAGQSVSPTEAPTFPPEPTPLSTPDPTPVPTAAPTPVATSDRWQYLEPCPDRPDCWFYIARRGNSLSSISTFFNVPFITVVRMNPQLGDPPRLQVGDKVFIPTPGI